MKFQCSVWSCLIAIQRFFWSRFVAADEIRIHHYTPESIQLFNEQRLVKVLRREAKTVLSAEKVLATVFWDI